eukprot:15439818-Alexandrium_andersonii.AAC.1
MQTRLRRSELELREPRSGLKFAPQSSRGLRSARFSEPESDDERSSSGGSGGVPRGFRGCPDRVPRVSRGCPE